jgi:hypothetical protein
VTTLAAAQKAQQAAEREQRRAEERLRELVEQHQREKESLEAHYRDRTEGIRSDLAQAWGKLRAAQQENTQLRALLEESARQNAELQAKLQPKKEPGPLVLVEWVRDTTSPANIENHVYEGTAGQRVWMPQGHAQALAGHVRVLGPAGDHLALQAMAASYEKPAGNAAELRERAAVLVSLASAMEKVEAALTQQQQQAEAAFTQRRAEAELAGAQRRAELAQQHAEQVEAGAGTST